MINSEKEAKAREVYARLRSECQDKLVKVEWTDEIKQKVLDIVAKYGVYESEEYLEDEVFNPESSIYDDARFCTSSIIEELKERNAWGVPNPNIDDAIDTLFWDEVERLNKGWELADICSSEDESELLLRNKESIFMDVCSEFRVEFTTDIDDHISPEELIAFLRKAWLDDEEEDE